MMMGCLGLNHRTTPVEFRERFAVAKHKLAATGKMIMGHESISQCVLLSTCNRMEIYFWADDPVAASREISAMYLEHDNLEVDFDLDRFFYRYEGRDAIRHLCYVLSGLDSMVLGETEILGQVKEAYRIALEAGLTGPQSNRVFQKAFHIAKKVRTETCINTGATSIGSVAVDLAEQIFGVLNGVRVMILGAGEMSRLTAQALKSRGAEGIFVANRSYDRAVGLADAIGGEAIRYDHWFDYLKDIDIVIASTAAPHYVITRDMLVPLRERRKYRSLFLIDIAVPRNIAPETSSIDEVYLYDIDTLQQLADQARLTREAEIKRCEAIIHEGMAKHFTQSF